MARIAKDAGYKVYALDIMLGDKLKALESSTCHIGRLDVTNPSSIEEFRKSIKDEPVDVLLNVAGKLGLRHWPASILMLLMWLVADGC
jgi:NADP-dependent 3-hydroxy acid dehydrogenase YdfG